VRREWYVVAGVTAAVVLVVAVVTAWLRPQYESEATLRFVESETGSRVRGELGGLARLGLPGLGDSEIDTDLDVLQSRRIAEEVVDSAALRASLRKPRSPRDSVLTVLEAPRSQESGRFQLRRVSTGEYEVRGGGSSRGSPAPQRITAGQPFALQGVRMILQPGADWAEIELDIVAFDDAVDQLRDEFTVRRERGASKLVTLSYRSPDRFLAAEVPNLTASSFMRYKAATSKVESRSRVGVLREQVTDYERQLVAAEDRLRRYREDAQIVEPRTQATEQIRRLASLQAQRDEMQVELESLSRLLTQIREVDGAGATTAYRRLAAFPSFVAHRGVQDMLQSLITLENERAELIVLRTESSIDVQGIDRRIRELELQVYEFGMSYLRGLQSNINAANASLAAFEGELATIPAREVEFVRLTREQALLDELYKFLQASLKDAEIQEAVDLGDVRLVDEARVPRSPVSPRPLINLALAAVMGLMLGLTTVVGRRVTDSRIQSAEEAEYASGVRVLGQVPPPALLGTNGSGPPAPALPDRLGTTEAAREGYRAVRITMSSAGAEMGGARLWMLLRATAAPAGAATPMELALTLARSGQAVALVDADLHDGLPVYGTGFPAAPGLLQVLRDEVPLQDALREVQVPGAEHPLRVLTSGGTLASPADILSVNRLRTVLEALGNDHDAVILNAPPLDRSSDALLLGSHTDLTLLVAVAGVTRKDEIRSATERLEMVGIRVFGIVLEGAPSDRPALASRLRRAITAGRGTRDPESRSG
jgi:uncharacterized protein involved in exopolysaccharide biosynthesis/Mrp family chromosome partitioning ATPase